MLNWSRVLVIAFVAMTWWSFPLESAGADNSTWLAGFAKERITPTEPMWMSGYAPRLAKSKLHDLWIKVLVLEAHEGNRCVLITADVCGFSRKSYEAIVSALEQRGWKREEIMLTCTHTHTGPALRECLHVCWPWERQEVRDLIEKYSLEVEAKIVNAVKVAREGMVPAKVSIGEGRARFAVNRRNNKESEVPGILARGEELRGPVDHSVPVLAVRTPEGKLLTVVFGYACHATTLAGEEWSGDYPGFAMLSIAKLEPGAEGMFFSGCSADQNPIPRRSVEVCRKYGEELASAVQATLSRPMQELPAKFRSGISFTELNFKSPLSVEYLQEKSREKSPQGLLAAGYLAELSTGRKLASSHPYLVQVWKLGGVLTWISLSGEVVVDYSLKYKAKFGPQTWVNGYAHDLVCYIPSRRILNEGGGQEVGVPWDYGIPHREWDDDIELRIDAAVAELVGSLE